MKSKLKSLPINLDSIKELDEIILGKRKTISDNIFVFNKKNVLSNKTTQS